MADNGFHQTYYHSLKKRCVQGLQEQTERDVLKRERLRLLDFLFVGKHKNQGYCQSYPLSCVTCPTQLIPLHDPHSSSAVFSFGFVISDYVKCIMDDA